jgi:hypothetical protein
MFSVCSKLNCWHCLHGNILKMVDNIASSIKRKPIASTSVFSRLWGSGVPSFRADAEGPSVGLALTSF